MKYSILNATYSPFYSSISKSNFSLRTTSSRYFELEETMQYLNSGLY